MAAWAFLRLVAWAVVGTLLVVSLATASALGLLGVDAAAWTEDAWSATRGFLDHNDRHVRQLVGVGGIVGTAISFGWGVYKIWHFAEVHMPARIAEFLEVNDQRLDAVRPMLLRAIEAPGTTKPMKAPVAFVGPLDDALRRIGFGHADAADADLAHAIEALEKKRAAAALYDAQTRRQLASAHLLRGMVLTALGGMQGSQTDAAAAQDRDVRAIEHFSAALSHDPADADALFYRGLVWARLGRYENAEADFQTALECDVAPKSVVRARANYCLAILLDRRNAGARAPLAPMAQAIASLPPEFVHSEEAGEMHLHRARIQERLGYTSAARTSCQDAITAVQVFRTRRARATIAAAETALRRLNESRAADANGAAAPVTPPPLPVAAE